MTKEQIEQCKREWASTEMSDLESGHLKAERLALYHKWFANLLAHARDDSIVQERDALLRGEFICKKCGLRKDSEQDKGDF